MIRKAMHYRKLWSVAGIVLIGLFVLGGCTGGGNDAGHGGHTGHAQIPDNFETTASADVLPSFLESFSPTTKDLYAKADAHADVLKELNCYCGCMEYNDPHDSLYRCFIAEKNADGVTWTDHGALCGVCMMEIRDAVNMAEDGKSLDEIKAHIDGTYGGGV
ncbi:PCYCGC motif-containing (lipo)protein [Paenibacillus alkalitolerans]|uniref:PCYCGC motif-containing (lipo)protein n=1 Tax=Paenibacillus alkalitolerans TaxID=2799335 RepID=UPI0018F4D739|nr:PCYCGC motif-containing (lipo)protein [Paenibacillus alkalitolerans]